MSTPESAPQLPPEAGSRPRLYVVALAHLDTQWRWTVRETAATFLPRTVRANEDRFRRFSHYRLNFEGAYRYRLLAECHPELFERVRARVAEGRWFPSGAAWEAFDTNLPAPESIVRQLLYGTRAFESAVGRAGRDIFLPDCFGFSQALPTLAVHCGIAGFATQKLRRGAEMRSAFGVPFPFGLWVGPDGSTLPAVLDPGEYGAQTGADLATDPEWARALPSAGASRSPAAADDLSRTWRQGWRDRSAATIAWLEKARAGAGAIEVVLADSEQIFRELEPATRAQLPVYDGELLLRLHATGCYSSRAALKRRHRQAEQLAHAAERAATIAHALGVRPADRERLREAWLRILAHEMHDDLTGTSLVEAYRYSAHDLALSVNELHMELEEAVGAVATTLDTSVAEPTATPLVVFNALGWERTDLVEVELPQLAPSSAPFVVVDAHGREVPSQWHQEGTGTRGCFAGTFPSLSFSRFEVRRKSRRLLARSANSRSVRTSSRTNASASRSTTMATSLGSSTSAKRELLAAPIGLEILANFSDRFPSWEIRWDDSSRPARTRIAGPVRTTVAEIGAGARRLRIERGAEGSRFVQTISLAAGAAGDHVAIDTAIDWRTDGALLKMRFPLSTPAEQALFDQGVGVARRPVATAQLYEVPAQQWAALREGPGATGAGAAIANDCKYGWDHPAADTLRLTLLHTPRIGRRFRYQQKQDFGHHEVRVAIAPIRPGESLANTVRFAERLNQPLRAFLPPAGGPAARRSRRETEELLLSLPRTE